MVFEATVRTCRDGCQPAFCSSSSGRSEPSYGRKKRSLDAQVEVNLNSTNVNSTQIVDEGESKNATATEEKDEEQEEEYVREMIEVNLCVIFFV